MTTVNWQSHTFTVYAPNTTWNDVGGVYIFAGQNSNNQWVALYIGKAESFKNRIPNHERWAEAVRLGATHIHAMAIAQEASPVQIESSLIQAFQPRLNTQQK